MGVKERKAREFQQREKEILSAAYNLLTTFEPIQMTMDMVAEKTEIGRGTIYKHFKSKDEIYAHLILRRREKYILTLKKISEEKNDLLQKLIRSYMTYCTNDPTDYSVHQKCVHHYLKSNIDKKLIISMEEQQEEKVKLVESIMKNGFKELSIDPPNSKYLIYAGWGMLSGSIELLMENRFNGEPLDEELFYNTVEQIFLSGIPKKA